MKLETSRGLTLAATLMRRFVRGLLALVGTAGSTVSQGVWATVCLRRPPRPSADRARMERIAHHRFVRPSSRWHTQRRLGSLATALTVAIATALSVMVAGIVPAAAATIPTYTWTGTYAAAPNWSNANNWTVSPTNAAPAPQNGATVEVVFPPASCAATACPTSNLLPAHNDVTGLTVNNLTIDQVAPSQGAIVLIRDLTGNPITLNGLLARSNVIDSPAPFVPGFGHVDLPIVLGANQTWTLSGGVSLDIRGAVTGSSFSLAVTLGGRSSLYLDGAAVSVGPVTVTGADPSQVDGNSFHNGYLSVFSGGSINGAGTNPNSVTVTDVYLNLDQSNVGPLTISGVTLSTGDNGGQFAHRAVASVQGSLALKPSGMYISKGIYPPSGGGLPVPGFDSSELTATGNIALNSALFLLQSSNYNSSGQPDCNPTLPVGAVYTLVAAGGTLTGTFDNYLTRPASPINNGDVIPVILGCSYLSPLVQINYTPHTVTATVLPPLTAPTIGTATAGPAQATVTFSPPAGNAAGYPAGMYLATATDLTTPGNGGQQGGAPVGSTTITIPNLISGDRYTFSVQARYGAGPGPASAASNPVTPTGTTTSTPPGSPMIGTATAGINQATVQFTAPSNSGPTVSSYTVTPYIGTAAQIPTVMNVSSGGAVDPAPGSHDAIVVPGLTSGTTYTFTVSATNGGGTGIPSTASNPVTPTAAPQNPVSGIATASSTPVTATSQGTTATASGGTGTVTVGKYASDPAAAPTGFDAAPEAYMDVKITGNTQAATPSFTSVAVNDCNLAGGTSLRWWNPAANSGAGAWQPVTGSPSPSYTAGPPACIQATFTSSSSPTLAQLTGTIFAAALPATPGVGGGGGGGGGVSAGGTFGSDPAGTVPTASNLVVVSITTPAAGPVSVVKGSTSPTLPGYRTLGINTQIVAPAATAAQSLKLTFQVYVGALPAGAYPSDVTVFHDGTPVPACPGASTASPDPCVANSSTTAAVETFTVLSSHASSWDFEAANVGRLGGADRFGTAVAVSQAQFPGGHAGAVVLARGDDYPDALVAAPLAAAKHAPLLLSVGGSLTPVTKTELQRVLPAGGTVYVLGGTGAVPASVATQLAALGYQVVRYGGVDRCATAVQVAGALGDPGTVLLATGTNFPDALSAGVGAAKAAGVVLLTNGGSLPAATSSYLAAHAKTVYAVGGPAAAADKKATALVGADRYATSVAVAGRFFPSPSSVGVASGTAFPDALSGGALLAHAGVPLVLAAPGGLPAGVGAYLSSVKGSISSAHLFGGNAALGVAVQTAVASTLGL